jgi:hypothetical protein
MHPSLLPQRLPRVTFARSPVRKLIQNTCSDQSIRTGVGPARVIGEVQVRDPPLPTTTDGSKFKSLKILTKRPPKVMAFEREFHGGSEEPELVAGIVARPFELVAVDRPIAEQVFQAIR